MEEERTYARGRGAGGSRRERRRGVGFAVLAVLKFFALLIWRTVFSVFTVALVGVCAFAIFCVFLMRYIDTEVIPNVQVDLNGYSFNQTSRIYYHDWSVEENDGWVLDQSLHADENRIVIPLEEMAPSLWQAAVAIEDHRFFEHEGVDWKRTAGAVVNTFTGAQDTFGGSTITQQVLKNITKDNDPYVKRKVREIFRALEFEKDHTKEEILWLYLNAIYFGKGCYGAETAAQFYFGKEAKDLSVAESASLVAITNNPSMYGPMYNITIKRKLDDGTLEETTPRPLPPPWRRNCTSWSGATVRRRMWFTPRTETTASIPGSWIRSSRMSGRIWWRSTAFPERTPRNACSTAAIKSTPP